MPGEYEFQNLQEAAYALGNHAKLMGSSCSDPDQQRFLKLVASFCVQVAATDHRIDRIEKSIQPPHSK